MINVDLREKSRPSEKSVYDSCNRSLPRPDVEDTFEGSGRSDSYTGGSTVRCRLLVIPTSLTEEQN